MLVLTRIAGMHEKSKISGARTAIDKVVWVCPVVQRRTHDVPHGSLKLPRKVDLIPLTAHTSRHFNEGAVSAAGYSKEDHKMGIPLAVISVLLCFSGKRLGSQGRDNSASKKPVT